ncbi:Ger(x)C family spore germination C-terminal domain-containing protein [Cohnella caldifontis]|uniref:Ger(x)C family spore germination C-terminal domain-containing protein n=1 Tax=Cohnella caldifontis TaxID=3027471 RepID=UPI0023EBB493|nr:Ger(x)C family spore germination C-terminal domain-containing protein [Cohnella sp. YIM B05605]
MRTQRFLRELREPGNTALLPSIRTSESVWHENGNPDPKLEIDGVYALRDDHLQGKFDGESIKGIRWLERGNTESRLDVEKNGVMIAALKLLRPSSRVKVRLQAGVPSYRIEIRAIARVAQLRTPANESELEQLAETQIRQEVSDTFETGIKRSVDLLRLEHRLFRYRFADWKKTSDGGRSALPKRLPDIQVKVVIHDTGMFKLKTER